MLVTRRKLVIRLNEVHWVLFPLLLLRKKKKTLGALTSAGMNATYMFLLTSLMRGESNVGNWQLCRDEDKLSSALDEHFEWTGAISCVGTTRDDKWLFVVFAV